jgi:hypothetical protein
MVPSHAFSCVAKSTRDRPIPCPACGEPQRSYGASTRFGAWLVFMKAQGQPRPSPRRSASAGRSRSAAPAARAGVEVHRHRTRGGGNGVGSGVGVQRLGDKIGQAVAVDVDEVVAGAQQVTSGKQLLVYSSLHGIAVGSVNVAANSPAAFMASEADAICRFINSSPTFAFS